MPGKYQYDIELKSNVAKLLTDMKEVQDRLDTVEGKEYKIKLNVDEKKLSNVISNLEKMLDSLGKGTGDFKQFENLSKELSSIVSEVQNLSKAFGKVDDSGTKTLLSSIQNIDKSLSELSQHIINVNKNMSNIGGDTNSAVKQVENISNAYDNATKSAEKLAEAQSKIGNKSNISSGTQIKDVFQGDKIDQATTSAKELDKILEQVDIPTDSFDDVLSKLDLTESKLKEIVKITKQSVSDSEGKFNDSYTLKDKRGSTEIYGLSSNTEKGQLLRSNIVEYDAKEIEKANKQILKSEQELQSQKDAFHKKNISAIDLEIQKREEESKMVSSALKTQMEERQKQLSSMESSLKSYQDKAFDLSIKPDEANRFPEYQAQLDSINKAIKDYENHINSLQNKGVIDPSDIDEANRLKSIIEGLLKNTKKFSSGDKGFTNIGADKVLEKINSILEQNSRMSKTAKDQIKAYYNEIYSGNPTRPLNEILDSVYKIVQQEREAGREGKSWLDVFKDKKIYSFIGQAASMFSFYDLISLGREGFETIKEYDKALTEMNKVSNESIEILKEFQQESFEVADSIGATASAIQNSTADWMKLGYSLKDSAELSEWANIYANVGDMEIDEATEHMVSSVKAWSSEFANDIEASEAIVDRYNHIGNSYAITSADIGEAMETSAAALKAGGNSLNESLGLIVSGNLIQQDASTTASALKILSLRVRGAKADLEEMGETTEGLADSSSKMREEIQALTGVDIMLDEDTFKSTAQIIKEIGAVWDSMSDVSQAATLEKIAGIIFCLKFVETHIYRTHLTALIA